MNIPTKVSTYLRTYLPTYLPTYVPTYLQTNHHCCEAANVVVVNGDKSSSVALSSFQLSFADVRVWVPNSCCILQLGPDKYLVASFLDMLWTGRQISVEKSSHISSLLSHFVHISIPRKIVADQDSQVLCILGPSFLPWMVLLASIGFLFLVIRITSHLSRLNDISQSLSHCCRASRSS